MSKTGTKKKSKSGTAEKAAKPAARKTKAVASAKTETKAKSKAKAPRKAKAAKAASTFDFIGKVESLLVRDGAGSEAFEFGLRGRHGKRRAFRLDAANPVAMTAMVHLVLAAHASEAKIGVRAGAESGGVALVREVERRPKLGKGA